jgi:GDP-L-fucose synthase
MFSDSKIYIAGHTGLLGSALMMTLAENGYNHLITRTHDQLDLTDRNSVDDFFSTQRPEYVFLAAGKVGGIASNKTFPADYLYSNIAIQNNVFEAAHRYDVKHLLFFGSSCIYPKECNQPIKEDYFLSGAIEETCEGYAVAKIAGVIACKVYNKQYKTNRFIALIPNSIYGPNDNFDLDESHVLSALLRRFHEAKINNAKTVTLWGSGKPRREFIFCEDIAGASLSAMQNSDKFENQHYNIGVGVDYSIQELAAIICKIVGYVGDILWDKSKPDGTAQKLLDSSSFLSLGWKPSVSFEAGLRKTYQWYLSRY